MSNLTNTEPSSSSAHIPLAALYPGILGLLPFWGLALATRYPSGLDPLLAVLALMTYSAIILSFIGALWWGLAVHAPSTSPRSTMFVWSVVPALIGWVSIMTTPAIGLQILIAGLVIQGLLDYFLWRKFAHLIPYWVIKLRTILTLGSTSALGFAWWQVT